jgi:hypothetical protein
MDRHRMGAAVTELSDADVFGAPAAAPAEMSDAEVFAAPAPKPAAASPTGPQGGLMQTIPQGIEMLGSEGGRAKLWEGVKKFPGDFAQGMIDFVKTPGTAYSQGVTPEEEVAFGLNAALGTIGTGTKFPRIAIEAIAPHVAEFEAGVTRPVAEQTTSAALTEAYHGSPTPFTEFKENGPYFFTPDAATASEYAATSQSETAAIMRGEKGFVDPDKSPHVVPAFLRMERPYTTDLRDLENATNARDPEWLRKNGYDSAILEDKRDPSSTEFIVLDRDQIRPRFGSPIVDDIISAKRAGIIGPDVPPPPAESPAMSAQRAIPAASQPGDKVTMTPAGEPIDAWAERFNRYVDKTETPDDFKTLVKDMAAQNNNYPEARSGSVAPEMVAKVAEAAGLDAADINGGKLRTSFRTDDEIRTVTTLLKKLGDDVQSAAEAVRTDGSPESLAAFQASIIKRDYALEATLSHTVALRAEWGRSGNALQEILRAQKGEDVLTGMLKDRGRTPEDLRDIARGLQGLDREQAAKVLTGMRGQSPHWLYWIWSQGLISGPFTHAKYVLANATYAGMERGVVTPMASIMGKAKQMVGLADADRVFFGETAAGYWGTVAAVPDAIKAAYQTIKTGMRVPLESEKQLHDMAVAAGEKPSTALSRAVEPNLQPPRPIPGIWGRILGAPGDAASSIHVAFKVLGERANLEMAAYNKAASEGLSPTGADFWQRRAYHALNPTEKALKDSVYQAYKDTFMQELGDHAKKFQQFTKQVPGMKWVFPFTHIPINLMKATYEYTPFAVLDKDMRANIKGENGGRAQDLAISRMVVGSSVMAYFTHKYMQGQVTSNYPTDPNERKDWALQGKPANSIQIGERWVSFERFGPAGDLAQIGAAIGSIAHRFAMDKADPAKGTDEAFSHAIWATANAAANTIGNEVGFQSLRNFMDAIEDEKKGGSFASYQATSMLPFSSLLTQTASFMDPHMRVAKGMVNALSYRIPELREVLLAKRDPLYGEPLDNPGYHGILRSLPINTDPVKLELERVNLHPTAPRDVIGGVKLTPEQYDRYQATAGPLVQRALTSLVNHPGWQQIPPADRADTLKATISAMRQQAATAMQISEPKLIQQGLQQRLDYISGKTNTPRPKRAPELATSP